MSVGIPAMQRINILRRERPIPVLCGLRVEGPLEEAPGRTEIRWGTRVAALLRKLADDGRDVGSDEGRALPTASLRAALQVGVPGLFFLDSALARPWAAGERVLLVVAGEDGEETLKCIRRAVRAWTDMVLRAWCERLGLGEEACDSFADALEDEDAIRSRAGSRRWFHPGQC